MALAMPHLPLPGSKGLNLGYTNRVLMSFHVHREARIAVSETMAKSCPIQMLFHQLLEKIQLHDSHGGIILSHLSFLLKKKARKFICIMQIVVLLMKITLQLF